MGRVVLLSKLEETVIVEGRRYDLSANQYHGLIHPQGHRLLREFRLDPFPVFTYCVEDFEIRKSVFMIHGQNSTVIQYHLLSTEQTFREKADCFLEVRPLIAFRDYHCTTRENEALNREVHVESGRATVSPYAGLPDLHFAHDAEGIDTAGYWYRSFEYAVERERGLDYVEDLFSPLLLTFDLRPGRTASLIASTQQHEISRVGQYRDAEILRREKVSDEALTHIRSPRQGSTDREPVMSRRGGLEPRIPIDDQLISTLVRAADQFIVSRGDQKTVLAGYHWFSDWGRDTMIALPGLALVTGRFEVAKSILLACAHHADQGMIPNRFPDTGETPDYNTVDATLWLFETVHSWLRHTGDLDFIRRHLYDVLVDIVTWHERGTRYGIHVDSDGLLSAGQPGTQLTWMDAKVGDWVVTPRHGKAVEIQALWYNALCVMTYLAGKLGDHETQVEYRRLARQARRSFNGKFWNESAGCLYDVVDESHCDSSLRPNQILAVSLPNSMLSLVKAKSVVAVVERELLTPYGLRSLAPGDPRYRGRYVGDQWSRDGAYHQGTVWAWLMGPFLAAYLKVNGRTVKARRQTAVWLSSFLDHLREGGLNQVSEIFDGDPPYRPRGCIAQAWSVGELLRVIAEENLF